MIRIKSPAELDRMRVSGRKTGRVRDRLAAAIQPGVTTAQLNEWAAGFIAEEEGVSAFLGYKGYPGQVCISINDEIVHGVPGPRVIQIGDIVSIDVGVMFDHYIGDTAMTVMVGVNDPEVIRLVGITRKALENGLAQCVAGARLSDVSHAIERTAVDAGFSVVREFVGHGVGRKLHEDPQIPNFGRPGRGPRLRPGMTLAIEPMINMGVEEVEVMSDGWTVLTADRKPSAHFEHTVAVTNGPPEILTLENQDD